MFSNKNPNPKVDEIDTEGMSEQEIMIAVMKRNNYLLKRYTSFNHTILRSILAGVGGFVGATIVVSIVVAGFSWLEFVPIVGNFVVAVNEFIAANYPQEGILTPPY